VTIRVLFSGELLLWFIHPPGIFSGSLAQGCCGSFLEIGLVHLIVSLDFPPSFKAIGIKLQVPVKDRATKQNLITMLDQKVTVPSVFTSS
jgi:hypothetical protein